jgi:hypothetical protein
MPPGSGQLPGHDADDVGPPAGRRARTGAGAAGLTAASVTAALLASTAVLVLYALVQFWPPAPSPPLASGPTTTTGVASRGTAGTTATTAVVAATPTTVVVAAAANPPVHIFGSTQQVEREARLFVVVALAGALGGLVYALRSLYWYTGNRSLRSSWLLMYPMQPVVGATLATITYVVIRGGVILVTTQSSPDVVNPFGFAAFGALVGLFSSQATEWLKRVFEQVFTPAMKGKDPAIEPRIEDFVPRHGRAGTLVAITGSGFVDVRLVAFNKVAATDVSRISDRELWVRVPDGASDGPITVSTSSGAVSSREPFVIDPGGSQRVSGAPEPRAGGGGGQGPDG